MKNITLTESIVQSAEVPPKDRFELWDQKLPGLHLRVTERGIKSFCVMYRCRGRQRRYTLGRYPVLSVRRARQQAFQILSNVAQGIDPMEERRQRNLRGLKMSTFRELTEAYLRRHSMPNKQSWRAEQNMIERELLPRLGYLRVDSITNSDIAAILSAIHDRGSPISANRCYDLLCSLFNWAKGQGLIKESPLDILSRPNKERPRERVLSDEEIRRLWTTLDAVSITAPVRAALKMMLLTGQRSGEVVGVTWQKISIEDRIWHIEASRTKNGRIHIVPLCDGVLSLLDSIEGHAMDCLYVFPSPRGMGSVGVGTLSKALRRNFERLDIEPFTPHDLRRTVATKLAQLGVNRLHISKMLNHSSADKSITSIYDRYDYMAEKRRALEKWEGHLNQLLE